MLMSFHFYVPAECTFENYFLPKIGSSSLEYFEVDRRRRGIQRKGNNHLVVFLDYCLKAQPPLFTGGGGGETDRFRTRTPAEGRLFEDLFGDAKEVAVFALSYHARMSVIAWKIVVSIADDAGILVKNDAGNLMRGNECAHDLKGLLGMDEPDQAGRKP